LRRKQTMEEKSPQTLKTGKISKLFWYYTLPSIFMLITQNIAYFVDSIFIGQYVGAEGLSALTLVMPFIIFLAGFAYMIAVGGITLAGIERGAGNTKESNNLFNVTTVLLVILGVLGGIFIHSFVPRLMRWIGTSETSVELITEYGQHMGVFVPFFLLSFALGAFIKLDERPYLAMLSMVLGPLVNIFLDYLLVAHYQLGMRGAAIATGLSQFITFVVCMVVIISKSTWNFEFPTFRFIQIKRIFYNGFSEFLTNITAALTGAIVNVMILQRLGESGVAAFAVSMQVTEFVRSIGYGIAEGNQALLSYNFGAKLYERVKETRNLAIKISFICGIVLTGLSVLFSGEIAQIFVTEQVVINHASEILMIFSLSFLFSGFNAFVATYYTSLNDPVRSGVIAIYRTVIAPAFGLIVLPLIFGDTGLWLTFVFIEVSAFFIGLLFLKKYPLGYFRAKDLT